MGQSSSVDVLQPNMVECREEVGTSDTQELAVSQNTSLVRNKALVLNPNKMSLLSLIMNDGGQIRSLSPSQLIIDIDGQTMVIIFTQDMALYNKHVKLPEHARLSEHVARWRTYLINWDVSSTALMISNVPTIIAFGSVSVLFQNPNNTQLVCM